MTKQITERQIEALKLFFEALAKPDDIKMWLFKELVAKRKDPALHLRVGALLIQLGILEVTE